MLLGSIVYLFYAGVGIWGIDWPVAWGFAIINYVWWIAIASGGTFISALFFLTRSEWRNSINRLAESMTLFGAACAGIYPILHLGRPWLFYWLLPYPATMHTWPQFRSPLLWDFFAILTYVLSSIVFWYLGLLPDLATMRDHALRRGKQVFYGILALGFRGTGRQWQHYQATYATLAAIMAPLVCSVHSIVGLDFAGANTVGWHSTQFPPFFIFGAFLSGFATVLILVIPLRRLMRLERYITGRHLDVLCRLLVTSSLFVAYAYLMDAFNTYYGAEKADITMYVEKLRHLCLDLLGDRDFQRHPAAALLVPRDADEPEFGLADLLWRHHRDVVRALHHCCRRAASLQPALVLGKLSPHDLGLADHGRYGRVLLLWHPAGRACPAGRVDVRTARTRGRQTSVMSNVLAAFDDRQALQSALHQLQSAALGPLET